ncbi:putative ribonuclease H protein [Vitis vinifera]|uniref:Putative ribonuclease H protein n=1 Tax=Vitis vinifera TaxID=29760 RepID=A0A438CJB4_VITVI|nr:putative ribonuclease H protein [Vitis vinifera]
MEDGFILSFRVGGGGREGVLSSNLLFVDDTLLFFNPCLDQLTYLAWVLLWFMASSGLKIILSKCELIPIGDVPNVEELASVMGCGIGKLLATYLGLPLCTSFKAKDVWDLVEESKFGRFREEEDKMVWKASKNEVFSVRSFYNALEDKGEVTFPSKIIWDSWAPTKAAKTDLRSLPYCADGGRIRRGPSPFRFENMWLKADGFSDLLRGWWQEIEVRGRASVRLATKMKVLKHKIKVWNREVFGRLEVNRNSALQQVEFWDGVERERSLSEGETELKKEAKDSFKKWVLLEETHWRQLSKELWLKEGDRNTGFFHRMANAHRRNNSLERMKINGVWLTEEKEMREGIVSAFQQVLSEEPGWRADVEGLHFQCLSSSEAENLEVQFSEEEIQAALMGMNGDKAPGPDGFTIAFWQSSWGLVKEEIMDLFREFYNQRSFANGLNSTFLVLIPKKGGAEDLGDQNAFVRGKQILDASLVANEVIDFWNKRKEKGLICKLDIEKAYDSINWRFLMKVMVKMGFGSRWLEWIWWCISTAKFSVMINGVPAGCNIKGRGEKEMIVSHLLFADDTIIFCEANKEQVSALSWVLAWFEAASGLRINLDKSVLIPVGEVEDIEELAVELGCKIGMLPTVYLGLPLGAHHKAVSIWDGVEERMRKRLAQWKRQYISKGGRITLIKCTMASLPIYTMSLFRMPKSVVKRLEKIQRDFLWGGGSLERKVHLINWEVVCTSKEKGGLGMRRIDSLNKALLGKWVWRFVVEKDNLWRLMIGVKYGQEEFGWKTREGRGTYGVGVWKEIMKEAKWCWENIKFKVGKGTRIKFWSDQWCGNERLSHAFPQLYEMAVNKNATVNEMWTIAMVQVAGISDFIETSMTGRWT